MGIRAKSKLEEVEAILNATASAPTFGLNSRELILRAARQACSEEEEELPVQISRSSSEYPTVPIATQAPAREDGNRVLSGMLADKLVQEGLTVHERPIVQYVPRTSIPRIARQVRGLSACISMEASCRAFLQVLYRAFMTSWTGHGCREWQTVWQVSSWLTSCSKLASISAWRECGAPRQQWPESMRSLRLWRRS